MKCISYQSIFSYKKSILGLITQNFQSHSLQPTGKQGLFLFISQNPISECFRNGEFLFWAFFFLKFHHLFSGFILSGLNITKLPMTSVLSSQAPCLIWDQSPREIFLGFTSFEVSFYFQFHLIQIISCQVTNTISRLYIAVCQRDI